VRHVSLGYLSQIAMTADDLGYYGVLLPTVRSCEDSWVIASAMVPLTRRLRFLVAVRPGLTEPAFAARTAATLDRLSVGRLLINVVTGGDPVELKGDGVFLDHDERYEVTDEFLSIWRKLMQGDEVTETHKHLRIEKGKLLSEATPTLRFILRLVGRRERRRSQARGRLPHMGRAA
jgi:alkanesulfonate monooxygenase